MDDVTDVCPPRDAGELPLLWRYYYTLCVHNQDGARKEWAAQIETEYGRSAKDAGVRAFTPRILAI
jgi:hypothetical protein